MAKKSSLSKIISLLLLCCGLKIQKPVKNVKFGKSLKYKAFAKAMAKTNKSQTTKYKKVRRGR